MYKSILNALFIGVVTAVLTWLSGYLQLPLWISLIGMAMFFVAPQKPLTGLFATLLTGLIGLFIGVGLSKSIGYIRTFIYKQEVAIGISALLISLMTKIPLLNYFSAALISFAILLIMPTDWIVVCQSMILGILFGFLTKLVGLFVIKENIH